MQSAWSFKAAWLGKLANMPDEEDPYDWSIDVAVAHHNALGHVRVTNENAEAMELFSRNEPEFSFIA